jgi:hypothetical protein
MKAEGEQRLAESNKRLIEIRKEKEAAIAKTKDADQKLQEIAKEKHQILIKQFYSIFNKNSIPEDQIDIIFNTYLADRCVTLEKSPEGKSFGRINSMKGVIKYLNDHPNVQLCNFTFFKSEIQDIPTLTEFLKSSKIKTTIAFKNGIPEDAKDKLAEVIAVNGGLKVKYIA